MKQEKYGFVYIWFDRRRKRYYIGSHWGVEDDGYICSSNWMRNSYNKSPWAFKRRILSRIYTNLHDTRLKESKWLLLIKQEELGKRYYNRSTCVFIPGTTLKHSDETKKHLREVATGKTLSPKSIAKRTATRQANGYTHSQETREKISKSNKGKIISEQTRKKLSEINMGKKLSEETKLKIRLNHNRDYSDPGFRKKCSEAARNRKKVNLA